MVFSKRNCSASESPFKTGSCGLRRKSPKTPVFQALWCPSPSEMLTTICMHHFDHLKTHRLLLFGQKLRGSFYWGRFCKGVRVPVGVPGRGLGSGSGRWWEVVFFGWEMKEKRGGEDWGVEWGHAKESASQRTRVYQIYPLAT